MKSAAIIVFIFLQLCLPILIKAQPVNLNEDTLQALMKTHHIPALGIGLIEDGKVSFTKVYGELAASKPAPHNAIFNVASLTKPVVSMLTLKLVSLGKWNLDEPLSKYWIDPDVKNDSNVNKLTTRHVLSHQTGFMNWRWLHPTKKLTFDFEPGTKFQYSGEGFEYLRKALEKKFNQPLDVLCDSLIFKPLQMNDSHMKWDAAVAEARFAKWHDKEGKQTYESVKPQQPNAADDMLTTLEDYSRFGAAVLNGFDLPHNLYKEMLTPTAKMSKNSAMCLGWEYFEGLHQNEIAILHTGSDHGVKTLIILFPKSKQGLVVFTNSDNGYLLYEKLISTTFGELGISFLKKAQGSE